MTSFLGRRTLASLLPLLVVTLGVFFLARVTGDPANLYLPMNATPEMREEFSQVHGFNDPVVIQLWHYAIGLTHLDFGQSLQTGEGALTMALRAFPNTLELAAITMLLATLIATALGSYAALRPNSLADRVGSFTAMIAASMPDFWFAIVGILVFAVWLQWLPTSGSMGPLSLILPVATLMIRPVGVLTQVVRGAMIAALSSPYVKFAKSKGASTTRVVTKHALRNAAAPALTVAADLAVGLINGAVVVETVFGWPGIGKLMIDAILQRDFAVLQAAVLVVAITIFVLNIAIDVVYGLLDARVRTEVNA
jgi:peptide/nickel transport system permease protein